MKLLLKEIQDLYIQDNFKRLQATVTELENIIASGGASTTINNTTVERIPLDGSEPISGTIEPDVAGAYDIGSNLLPLGALYSDEIYLSGNSIYVNGKKAITYENGRVTYASDTDSDVEVRAKGTGTLYIECENDISINSGGTVTVNGDVIAAFSRDRLKLDVQSIVGNQVVLTNTPQPNSEFVILDGLVLTDGVDYDYTLSGNTITFNAGVLTTNGHLLRIDYAY